MITLIIVLLVFGFAVWFINTFFTALDPKFKAVINFVIALALLLYLLDFFGVYSFPALRK